MDRGANSWDQPRLPHVVVATGPAGSRGSTSTEADARRGAATSEEPVSHAGTLSTVAGIWQRPPRGSLVANLPRASTIESEPRATRLPRGPNRPRGWKAPNPRSRPRGASRLRTPRAPSPWTRSTGVSPLTTATTGCPDRSFEPATSEERAVRMGPSGNRSSGGGTPSQPRLPVGPRSGRPYDGSVVRGVPHAGAVRPHWTLAIR